jgi:hypothetical protein
MGQRSVPLDLQQQALDLVELYGTGRKARNALGTDLPPERTIDHRAKTARLNGLKPTVRKDAPRVYNKERLGRMHLVIPDVQAKAGVPLDHMEWIGNFIVEKKPDVIIQIGDFADMPSLSSHSKPLEKEGQRYLHDIAAVRRAQEKLFKPIDDYNRVNKEKYKPKKVHTKGNHEYRITRMVEELPWLQKKMDETDLGFEDYGWEVHDFLRVVEIDGIEYCHYFTSGVMGRPVSSAAAMLRERQKSCTQGHVQYTDMAIHKKTQNIGLFCGICYLHDEGYLGPQGNNARRQIIVKHEVDGKGHYDPMFVSLNFLRKFYS